ncbi:MAG: hypothetical protein ACRDKS_05395 [Actinomycetota bacterium]
MPRFRASIIWLAAIFVVTGSAIGVAKVGDHQKKPPNAESNEAPEPADIEPEESAEPKDQSADESGERKHNHGFFVSQAAHCEDVDDPDTAASPDFVAPEDCGGSGHGAYVSSVAKSSVGKKPKKS